MSCIKYGCAGARPQLVGRPADARGAAQELFLFVVVGRGGRTRVLADLHNLDRHAQQRKPPARRNITRTACSTPLGSLENASLLTGRRWSVARVEWSSARLRACSRPEPDVKLLDGTTNTLLMRTGRPHQELKADDSPR